MSKYLLLLAFLLLSTQSVLGAKIYGSIYSLDLNLQDKVILEISTSPKQIYVSRNGTYLFETPKGKYTIKAWQKQDDLFIQEKITIKDEGEYNLDLILLPNLQDEVSLLNETEENIPSLEEVKGTGFLTAGFILFFFVLLFGFIHRLKHHSDRKEPEKKEIDVKKETKEEKTIVLTGDLKKVVDFIKKEDNRTTQKEIRKAFPQSEAKISLIIAELEEKGIVKKIKKGRGNIVILK